MAPINRYRFPLLIAMCAAWAFPAVGQDSIAIRGGRILTLAGEPVDDGIVLIRDGKIAAIGTDIDIPVDATIIDARDRIILPGFVEAHSSAAMSQANEANPNVPYVSVVDSIDPMRGYFDEARRNGVTSVAVVPGNSTMIGGQAAIIKTGGTFVDNMLLKRQAGMKISLQPQSGGSRMGHMSALRAALDKAKQSPDESETDGGDGSGEEAEDDDSGEDDDEGTGQDDGEEGQQEGGRGVRDQATEEELQSALRKLVAGEMPAFIYCQNAMDVHQALRLAEDYDIRPILVLGRECYRAADAVAGSGFPVILDSTQVYWETDPRTDESTKVVLPRVFREAGVDFVFQVSGSSSSSIGSNYLWYQAAQAVKYGMPIEQALEALTVEPARILGVDQFVGTIEVGKDADLIILTGEPLKLGTWVETTIVNGQVVYERSKDFKLQRLLNGEEDAADTSSQR